MSLRQQLKLLLARLNASDRAGRGGTGSGVREFLDGSRLVAVLIFVTTVAAIALISFLGVSTAGLPVLPGQLAGVRVVASAPFSYESAEQTRLAQEQARERVPRVFRLENAPLEKFEAALAALLPGLDQFEQTHPPGTVALLGTRDVALGMLADAFNARADVRATAGEIAALLAVGDAKARAGLAHTALAALRQIAADGVQPNASARPPSDGVNAFLLARPDGTMAARPVQSLADALTFLRVSLASAGVPPGQLQEVFGFFSRGVTANVVFDTAATQSRMQAAVAALRPVTVSVERGDTILEAGDRVTAAQVEMLAAHRDHLRASGDAEMHDTLQIFYRVLLVLAMVMAGAIFIRLEDRATLNSNVRLALLALVVVGNLVLVRLSYALTNLPFFANDPDSASLLPYLAPTAIAPIVIAVLIDAGSASFMALLISIFTGVVYGNRLDLLVLTFLGSMVAIYGCRHTSRRGGVLRASAFGGLTVAGFALLLGVADQLQPLTVVKHMGTGLGTGLLTGVIVVGLLPVFEGLFKRTTDITFLELTDYNHPLLRLMQLEAPGTYHHSLMVAQLAEHAAAAIGANPLLARVCALYHDIGKTGRPEFFVENLRAGLNPHDSLPPARSAEIILAHVEDGVRLAHQHKLPRAIVDVIRQHHGTTLVRYFYQRAVALSRVPFPPTEQVAGKDNKENAIGQTEAGAMAAISGPSASTQRPAPGAVDTTVFRYPGPRPRTKESAIIHLADGVEAAARSLREVTPDRLAELIARIVRDRVDEHQLDEAPLTFAELGQIKESFARTLHNMTHTRVEYPAADLVQDTEKAPAAT
ncbi:MAG: HDIG domain-containing metalloprotein [Verrucomicrobiota bacterium]